MWRELTGLGDGRAGRQETRSIRFNMSIKLGVSENTTRCKERKLGNQNLGDKRKEKSIDEVSRSILGTFTPTNKHKGCSLWLTFFFFYVLCLILERVQFTQKTGGQPLHISPLLAERVVFSHVPVEGKFWTFSDCSVSAWFSYGINR